MSDESRFSRFYLRQALIRRAGQDDLSLVYHEALVGRLELSPTKSHLSVETRWPEVPRLVRTGRGPNSLGALWNGIVDEAGIEKYGISDDATPYRALYLLGLDQAPRVEPFCPTLTTNSTKCLHPLT